MVSFLIVLAFAPVLWGSTWAYMSPLRRLDGYTLVKASIRIVLAAAIVGGIVAQFNYLGHHVPLNSRRLYGIGLLVIQGIPMLVIMIYREYHNRSIS